jgi:tetratricopeptide (TPR) repeat protein
VIPIILREREFVPIFKRKRVYSKENEIFKDSRFIDLFSEGASLHMRGKHREAIEKLKQAVLVGPQDFALIYEIIGRSYFLVKDYNNAETYLKKAVQIDECSILAHTYLANIYQDRSQGEEMETEKRKVTLCDPNFVW